MYNLNNVLVKWIRLKGFFRIHFTNVIYFYLVCIAFFEIRFIQPWALYACAQHGYM